MGLLFKNAFYKGVRRKKNSVLLVVGVVFTYAAIQIVYLRDHYRPLQPLYDAEGEAQRLLRFLTSYHYQCNTTIQIGNSSNFPLCVEKDIGLQIDSKAPKMAYSIGPHSDYAFERMLALNLSFQVYAISHRDLPFSLRDTNNTHVVKTTLVPNDYADFSRNSYGQQTINDLMLNLKHSKIDVLKLEAIKRDHEMWEMLHFMTNDNVLLNVDQLHIAVYIDRIDDDTLFNWYRSMYELYYQQGFRLYHTSAANALCLQVTMMQSCLYFTSWVRIPSNRVHVLHPPADYGTLELEEGRLLDYLGTMQECGKLVAVDESLNALVSSEAGHATWWLCHDRKRRPVQHKCVHFKVISRLKKKSSYENLHEPCSQLIIEPMGSYSQPVERYTVISTDKRKHRLSWQHMRRVSAEDLVHLLHGIGPVSVLEISSAGYEWHVLDMLLNSGVLKNVSQLLLEVQLPHRVQGKHPSVYRDHYSQLRRLQAQDFQLYSTKRLRPALNAKSYQNADLIQDCCFRLGFIQKETKFR